MPVRFSEIDATEIEIGFKPLLGDNLVEVVDNPKWEQTPFTDKNGNDRVKYELTVPVVVLDTIEGTNDMGSYKPVKVGDKGWPTLMFIDDLNAIARQQSKRLAIALGGDEDDGGLLAMLESDGNDPFEGLVSGVTGQRFVLRGRLGKARTYYTSDGEEREARDTRYSFYPEKR